VRMWAITGGFHRYFSHRSYKTSRAFQFVIAFLGQTAAQRGALWWAAIHRHHHLYSDTVHDIHSPRHTGFWFSHMGWIFSPPKAEANYESIPDLTRYPELRWLDRHPYLPAVFLGVLVFLLAGWPGLIVGFFWSTVVLYHGVFAINSLAHVVGEQRYVTGDDSRNNWWLALITLGEGWHNNHHHYQSSTRQGFRWYEVDATFYALKALSWVGLVWDLRAPPPEIVANERRLGSKVVESVARQVALSFSIERLTEQAADAWARTPNLQEIRDQMHDAGGRARARVTLWSEQVPEFPSREDVEQRIHEMFAESPSLEEITSRTRELIVEAIEHRILGGGHTPGMA
jgi:stearoyl-CoA desaturase (delta-9 desaturase)